MTKPTSMNRNRISLRPAGNTGTSEQEKREHRGIVAPVFLCAVSGDQPTP